MKNWIIASAQVVTPFAVLIGISFLPAKVKAYCVLIGFAGLFCMLIVYLVRQRKRELDLKDKYSARKP